MPAFTFVLVFMLGSCSHLTVLRPFAFVLAAANAPAFTFVLVFIFIPIRRYLMRFLIIRPMTPALTLDRMMLSRRRLTRFRRTTV